MNADRFLVFVRSGAQPWRQVAAVDNVSLAVTEADVLARRFTNQEDRAVVMETSGVDALPMFTYRYGVKK